MSNGTEVTLFSDKGGLPAHLADLNDEANTNIIPRETIPQLSFRGKVWRVVTSAGEDIVYKTVNGQPTDEPASVVGLVILDYNKNRSRAFFEGAYEEGKSIAPSCWSNDGVLPHDTVQVKQHPTCAGCPQAAKGSRISDSGKELTACSTFRRVAVVPIQNTKHEPLLLRLPQTSCWDKDAEEFAKSNFFAFDQYMDVLRRRGINHTAAIVTKIKFDPRTAYPKLLFAAMDFTPADVYADISASLANRDAIEKILNADPNNQVVDSIAAAETATAEEAPPAATPAPPPPAARPTATPRATVKPGPKPAAPKPAAPPPPPPPTVSSDDDDAELMGRAAPAAAAAVAQAARPAPGNAARPATAPKATAAKPAEPVQVVSGDKGSGIGDLLSAWENE
jgi:hypothetical protein